MSRLIDADALKEKLSKGTIITDDLYGMGIMAGVDHAIKILADAPTIKAEPVQHSFWEEYDTSSFGGYRDGEAVWWKRKFFRCERCRKGSAIRSSYCPNCGARMDKEG